jgi:hypothetical protein
MVRFHGRLSILTGFSAKRAGPLTRRRVLSFSPSLVDISLRSLLL